VSNGNVVARPTFSEGQILSASSLDLGVDYARESLERHSEKAHTVGVVEGMLITFKSQAPPGTANDAYVSKGMAVDGSGRQINFLVDTLLVASVLGSQPAGWYSAYVWVSDEPGPVPQAVDPCATSSGDTVLEQPNAAFIIDTSQTSGYVCIGQAYWDPATKGLSDNGTPAAKAIGRQLAGVRVGEIIATENGITVCDDPDDPTKPSSPMTMTVVGDIRAKPDKNNGGGVVGSDGGALELRDSSGTNTVSAAYSPSTTGGNEFLVTLTTKSKDPNSMFVVAADSDGTIAASIDAAGNIHGTGIATIDGSLTVGSVHSLTIGPTAAPGGPVGVAASGDLPLQFGKNSKAGVYDDTGNEVAEFDKTQFKVFGSGAEMRLGQLASGHLGVESSAGALDINVPNGDLNLATSSNLNINGYPVWQTISGQPILRLGPITICFGTVVWTGRANSDNDHMDVSFPVSFTAPPQVLLSAVTWTGTFDLKMIAQVSSVRNSAFTMAMIHVGVDGPGYPQNQGDPVLWDIDNASPAPVSWLAIGPV